MIERTWRCKECKHFFSPNYCTVKGIKVDRNYDDYCDLAEEIEEMGEAVEETLELLGKEADK